MNTFKDQEPGLPDLPDTRYYFFSNVTLLLPNQMHQTSLEHLSRICLLLLRWQVPGHFSACCISCKATSPHGKHLQGRCCGMLGWLWLFCWHPLVPGVCDCPGPSTMELNYELLGPRMYCEISMSGKQSSPELLLLSL